MRPYEAYTLTRIGGCRILRLMSYAEEPESSHHIASGTPRFAKKLLLSCVASFSLSVATYGAEDSVESLRQALAAICEEPSSSLTEMAGRIPGGSIGVSEEALVVRGMDVGWERRFALPDDTEIRVEQFAPQGNLRRLTVEYWEAEPAGDTRPLIVAIAGAECAISLGRRLVYESDSSQPVAIEHLNRELRFTGEREPLNPAVPDGTDPGGVAVAHVDSGVNYLLPEVGGRLARDEAGAILGYDYWDMDGRPFDSHPARSPFFPQRHGTRTATLLLQEAPEARLVPYRYPRPDMTRMSELVANAAVKGISVFNISMGSDERSEWEAFAAAAENHPDMLFVLSAGNDGRDIDARPVYPAALGLDNAIVVTSALANGELARGSNWGEESVDLMVPAERLRVTDFDGSEVPASSSSYAAIRVSALAARLLAEHPDWGASELKDAIFVRVLPSFSGERSGVAQGFMPRPDKAERLPPLQDDGRPGELARHTFTSEELYPEEHPVPSPEFVFEPTLAYFEDTAWGLDTLRRHAREAAEILSQCGIRIPQVEVRVLEGPDVYRYFHDAIGSELVRQLDLPKPTVYFVTDTLQIEPYDAEAIGKSNSATRPALRYTVWFTEATRDPGIALAHELVHILMDSGEHVEEPGNLMRAETSPENTELTTAQCEAVVSRGTDNALLTPIGE